MALGITLLCQSPSWAQEWTRASSGPGDTWLSDIAIDNNGNIYTAGYFSGLETIQSDSLSIFMPAQDGYDGLLVKHAAEGQVERVLTLNGMGDQRVRSVSTNSTNEVIICGNMQGTVDFDPAQGIQGLTADQATSFIASYDDYGNLLWRQALTTDGYSILAYDLEVDSEDNVYVAGTYTGTMDADPGPGQSLHTALGISDSFLIKLDRDGNLLWAQTFSGPQQVEAYKLAIDHQNNVLITGMFATQCTINTGGSSQTLTAAGGQDVFIIKLNDEGELQWANTHSGTGYLKPYDIAVDAEGNVVSTGQFTGTADFDPANGTEALHSSAGGTDAYLCKLSPEGEHLWSRSLGGELTDLGHAVVINDNGDIYWTGQYWGEVDLMTQGGSDFYQSEDVMDLFLLEFTADGEQVSTEVIGGLQTEYYPLLALSPEEDLCIAASFTGDIDTAPGSSVNAISASGYDYVLSKYLRGQSTTLHEWDKPLPGIDLWPNPSQGDIHIRLEHMADQLRIEVADAMGRRVHSSTQAWNPVIDLHLDLAPGLYSIVLSDDAERSYGQRIILR